MDLIPPSGLICHKADLSDLARTPLEFPISFMYFLCLDVNRGQTTVSHALGDTAAVNRNLSLVIPIG